MRRCEMRIDPATAGWFEGTPTGLGHMRAWFRMRDGRAPSTIMLLQVVDALPPVAHDLGVSGWVPTLELTVHVRQTGPRMVADQHLVGELRKRVPQGGRRDSGTAPIASWLRPASWPRWRPPHRPRPAAAGSV